MTDEEQEIVNRRKADVHRILHPETAVTAPQANGRKRRSDAGKPREIKTGPLEVTIRLPLEDARQLPFACSATERVRLAFEIQDQILAQLQKQLAQLQGKR